MTCKKWIREQIYSVKINVNEVVRYFYCRNLQKHFTNRSVSLFSSNCVGGRMLHDLNVRFNSPFINLYLNATDYLKFLKDPQKYIAKELQELETEHEYPVAAWGDLTIHFVHYESYQEAAETFYRRMKRIDFNNLYIIFSERDGCTFEDLKTFDSLPYKNKIVFTRFPYEEIKSSFYMRGYENEEGVGILSHWDTNKIGRKIYDRFNFAEWLNG